MQNKFKQTSSWKMPKFWYRSAPFTSILPELLLPFSVIYYLAVSLRNRSVKPEKLGVPVICVGNLTAGGAGKTPVAIEVVKLVLAMGKKVAFVSRGYGGTLTGPVKVDLAKHQAYEVGDEPILLAETADCWIGKDKLATAKAAIADGAEVLVLDDGLQNPSIVKDVALAVVDGGFGLGNKFTIPSGPLREPLPHAMRKTDAAILIGEDKTKVTDILRVYAKKLITAQVVADAAKLEELKNPDKKFIAFAGLALPQKFFNTLKDADVQTIDNIDYPDHYNYSDEDIEGLIKQAETRGAELVTTEKDAARIREYFHDRIHVLPIKIIFADDALKDVIRKIT